MTKRYTQVGPHEFVDTDSTKFPIELGRAIEWGWVFIGDSRHGYTRIVDEQEVLNCLIADACAELPSGARFEIRKKMPTNYGRSHGMAWYHSDGMAADTNWCASDEARFDAELGVIIVKRMNVPPKTLPVTE